MFETVELNFTAACLGETIASHGLMHDSTVLGRRDFLGAASVALAGGLAPPGRKSRAAAASPILADTTDYTLVDSHLHLFGDAEENERILGHCRQMGIDRICAFLSGASSTGAVADNPNRVVMELRRRHPAEVIAFARADAREGQKAIDELVRVVEEHDFRGLKQSFTVRASDPAIFPLIEKTIDLKIPVLFHTFMDKERKPERATAYPGETSALELVSLAARYPEATFIMAHYNLGDWEYGLKAVKDSPNIYLSTGGSGLDAGYIEAGIREVGVERIVFGTDNSICSGVAKICNAQLSDDQRRAVFGENLLRLLQKRGPLS